jgi:hypothetical protein
VLSKPSADSFAVGRRQKWLKRYNFIKTLSLPGQNSSFDKEFLKSMFLPSTAFLSVQKLVFSFWRKIHYSVKNMPNIFGKDQLFGRHRIFSVGKELNIRLFGYSIRPVVGPSLVTQPLPLQLGKISTHLKTRPVVVEGLSMPFNLAGPFLKRHGIDQIHS